jgi:1,4-dihydroxy-2-naphthoate octaprenyltransferase
MKQLGLWWQATRPFAFPASVIPAFLGGLVPVIHDNVGLHLVHYLLAALAAACVHAASNLLNDFFDFRKGVDCLDTTGASRGVIVSGRMTPRQVLAESIVLWLISAALAVYFLLTVGTVLVPLILLGLLLGAGYTAAPTELKYRALGDLTVFLAFGVGITVGSYVIQTGKMSWTPVAYSLPMALLIWAILHANNLRDLESDRQAQITTLAMLLGPSRSRMLYVLLLVLAYGSLIVSVATGKIVTTGLLALVSIPLALSAVRQVLSARRTTTDRAPNGLTTLDMRTAQLQMAFGLLMILGLLSRMAF